MTTGMGYDAYSTYAGVTSAAFLGVLVLFAKPRQNTVLKCAWLGLLAPAAGAAGGQCVERDFLRFQPLGVDVHHAGSLYPGAGLPRHNGV